MILTKPNTCNTCNTLPAWQLAIFIAVALLMAMVVIGVPVIHIVNKDTHKIADNQQTPIWNDNTSIDGDSSSITSANVINGLVTVEY